MHVENATIQGLINAFLIVIPAGVVARVMFCMVSIMHDEEERGKCIRRAKNAGYFGIVAELAVILINLVYRYYSQLT